MKYNFDEVIDRKGTHAVKVERLPKGADTMQDLLRKRESVRSR